MKGITNAVPKAPDAYVDAAYSNETLTLTKASGSKTELSIEGGGVQFTLKVTYSGASDCSGIAVTATPADSTKPVATGTTNSAGIAYLTVKQNATYTITSAKDGYSFESTPEVTCADLTTEAAISCYIPGVVTITVVDAKGGSVAGRTVTATCDGQTTQSQLVTASGVVSFTLPAGEWTFVSDCPEGATSTTVKVTVEVNQTYSETITLKYGYGFAAVVIDESVSDCAKMCEYPDTVTVGGTVYTNSCKEFTPASGASGSFSMGSWANHKILEGIKPVSKNGDTWTDLDTDASQWASNGSSEDYFTEFPFQWLSITKSNNKITIIFSDNDTQPDSTFQCYAHAKGCDNYSNAQIESAVSSASRSAILESNNNSYFANAFHLGCFNASGSTSAIYSKKATTALVSTRYAYYWQAANARGDDYDGESAQQRTYVQALFLLLYRNTNSQTAHSYGLASGSQNNTNAALATTAYGMAGSASSARNAFFWLHDFWGNFYEFIGGMWNRAGSSSKLYYWLPRQANSRAFNNGWTAATTYATQANLGTDTGLSCSNSGGYIKTVAGNNVVGFAPTNQSGGSESTYWPDNGGVYYDLSNARFPGVGGYCGDRGIAGLFYCNVGYLSTGSYSGYGARLSYRGGRPTA